MIFLFKINSLTIIINFLHEKSIKVLARSLERFNNSGGKERITKEGFHQDAQARGGGNARPTFLHLFITESLDCSVWMRKEMLLWEIKCPMRNVPKALEDLVTLKQVKNGTFFIQFKIILYTFSFQRDFFTLYNILKEIIFFYIYKQNISICQKCHI